MGWLGIPENYKKYAQRRRPPDKERVKKKGGVRSRLNDFWGRQSGGVKKTKIRGEHENRRKEKTRGGDKPGFQQKAASSAEHLQLRTTQDVQKRGLSREARSRKQ